MRLPEAFRADLDRYVKALEARFGPDLVSVVLFGSWARGEGRAESDIDLLVIIGGLTGGRFERDRPVRELTREVSEELFLPLDLPSRPPLQVVTSDGIKSPAPSLRSGRVANGARPAARAKGEQVELPLFRVSEIVVASSGISISTDLIEECCERGIHLSFLTPGGRPFAMLASPMLTATVLTRREQMAAFGDRRGLELAKAIVRGKLGNQAALLTTVGNSPSTPIAGQR